MNKQRLIEARENFASWGKLNPDRLEVVLKYAGRKILDIGCSSGEYVRSLLQKSYDAYGLDLFPSPEWSGPLKQKCQVGDVLRLPYPDNSFDTVLLFEILEHVDNPAKALAEVWRVTADKAIISVPDATLYPLFQEAGLTFFHWTDRSHVNFFTPQTIQEELRRSNFAIELFKQINPVYPEIIFWENFRIPPFIRKIFLKITRNFPWRKKYYMTLLVVAKKQKKP